MAVMGPKRKITLGSCAAILVFAACFLLSDAVHCPTSCLCRQAAIDCSHSKLSTVPHMQPKSSAQVLNFSFNSLTSLDNPQNFPTAHTSLDLSHNQLSHIPLNFFSGEPFVELRALNLSANVLTDILFVFPYSLEILRLGKNDITTLCVERLKNLSQLKVLHAESSGIKTLSCQVESEPGGKTSKPEPEEECPFPALKRINEVFLQGNKLRWVEQGLLRCLQNAQFMSLADNAIKALPPRLFRAFQRLKYLDLSGNRLTYIQEGLFNRMPQLKFLSLSGNRLVSVPAVLPMLEWLDLSHNAITSVAAAQRGDVYPQEVFLMGGNPLHCNCQLLWLKELFDTREYLIKFVDVERSKFVPICASPDALRGDTWDVLGDSTFGCGTDRGDEVRDSSGRPDEDASEEQPAIVHLEDLAFKVQDVSASHIRLQWDSLDLLSKRSASPGQEAQKVFINIHPFGQKKQKQSLAVALSVGTHRIIGLLPSTAYVVCISLADQWSSKHKSLGEDCVEVVTKDDEQFQLRDIYMRIGVVVLGFALLALKCCFTSGLHKDMASRRKNQ